MTELPWDEPLGAGPGGFRVWAPRAETVVLRLGGRDVQMAPAGLGVFVADVPASTGDDYAFVLDGGAPLPDPASRWQPAGLRGPSRVWIPDAAPAPFTPPPAP